MDAAGSPYMDSIGQMLSIYCVWAGPDAPVWDADVCCTIDDDGAACVVPDSNGRCAVGDRTYCEYGAKVGGGVVCYQPFPSMCDEGFCIEAPDVPPVAQALGTACCGAGGACQPVTLETLKACLENGGKFVSCSDGVEYEDGTMDCWD
ncbi:hypothetical protein DB30_06896 [Enhygromyxa salina]|uniref:Uncharacterized protein n=1 Tax=Enhygromyxa salina TaxID=215803 RepID=A0A0C1Z9P8_9BACT|nr:hypothetical protein [Enhygromyxa salina]KIG14294.1 hypothetical protein DB30_06896 [Enhygromyxa salina]